MIKVRRARCLDDAEPLRVWGILSHFRTLRLRRAVSEQAKPGRSYRRGFARPSPEGRVLSAPAPAFLDISASRDRELRRVGIGLAPAGGTPQWGPLQRREFELGVDRNGVDRTTGRQFLRVLRLRVSPKLYGFCNEERTRFFDQQSQTGSEEADGAGEGSSGNWKRRPCAPSALATRLLHVMAVREEPRPPHSLYSWGACRRCGATIGQGVRLLRWTPPALQLNPRARRERRPVSGLDVTTLAGGRGRFARTGRMACGGAAHRGAREQMLAGGPWRADAVLLHEPVRDRAVTAWHAAIMP